MADSKLSWIVASVSALLLLSACGGGAPERKEQYIERGREHVTAGDYEKARLEFQNALQVDPKDAEAQFLLGQVIQKLGEPAAAVARFQAVLEISPDHAGARSALARLYALAGLPELADRAMELVDKGLLQNPDDAGLLTARAAVRVQRRDVEGAIEDAERAHAIAPSDGEAVGILASLYMQKQEPEKAIALLQAAVLARPADIELSAVLADLYLRKGQMAEAEGALLKVVELQPAVLSNRTRLARFYIDRQNVDAAEAVLRDGIKVSPEDPQAKTALLVVLAAHRAPETVEAAIKEFLAADGKNAELRVSIGDFYGQRGHADQAREAYLAVIALDGTGNTGLIARNKLAALAIQANDLPRANQLISEILAQSPRDAQALTMRGSLAVNAGQYDAAIADLRNVLRDQPGSVPALRALAQAQARQGGGALAEETLRSALQSNPLEPSLRYDLAMLIAGSGRNSQALPMLEQLAREMPGEVGVLRALFAAQVVAQNHAGALATAKQVERLLPQSALGPLLAGQVQLSAGQTAQAKAEFERALKLEPKAVDPLVALVRLEVAGKQLDSAAARIEGALATTADSAELHAMKGLIRIEQRQLPEALKSLAEAQRLSPRWWEPYRSEGLAQMAAGQEQLAYAAYRKGIAASSTPGPLVDELAALYEAKGHPDDAIQVYEEALVRDPQSLGAANNLALLLVNYRSEAAKEVARAVALAERLASATGPAFLDTRGWVLLKAGRALEALPLLQDAARAENATPVVHYHLAVAQIQSGDTVAARRSLERALQPGRNFAGRDDAKRQLAQLERDASSNRAG